MTHKLLLLALIVFIILCGCTSQDNELEDTKLTPETNALYYNLQQIAQTNILFGHQDALAYGIGWTGNSNEFKTDVQLVSGDHPAVFGWDIGHIDSSKNIDGIPFENMQAWMIAAYENGGINTISWHGRNFLTGGTSWDTTKLVDKILPGGELHELYKTKLDKVADFIAALETEDGTKVPVIFRPYHEHNGHWFWWGNATCNNEEYKQLWQFTADYLRETKKVNNMLLCYSTDAFDGREDYLSRYPGDKYVDILGWDDYKSIVTTDTRDVFVNRITILNELAHEKNKLVILSEGGTETIPNPNWWTEVLLDGFKAAPSTDKLAYVLVWRNANKSHHYAPYPGHASIESFVNFKNDSVTMFLNDVPDIYNKMDRK